MKLNRIDYFQKLVTMIQEKQLFIVNGTMMENPINPKRIEVTMTLEVDIGRMLSAESVTDRSPIPSQSPEEPAPSAPKS
jgi:hypothetical protein